MDMFGKVGLVEIPILIAPDQKAWLDRMIKEGKIAIPPGGTLEKGSLYSMFIRMLLHNAMEEQKRQVEAAIKALEQIGDCRAIGPLVLALKDGEDSVRQAAAVGH